jgi:hypothetical protein
MPIWEIDYGPARPRRLKVWRYPGVLIPYRLRDKYADPSIQKAKR